MDFCAAVDGGTSIASLHANPSDEDYGDENFGGGDWNGNANYGDHESAAHVGTSPQSTEQCNPNPPAAHQTPENASEVYGDASVGGDKPGLPQTAQQYTYNPPAPPHKEAMAPSATFTGPQQSAKPFRSPSAQSGPVFPQRQILSPEVPNSCSETTPVPSKNGVRIHEMFRREVPPPDASPEERDILHYQVAFRC